jgi:hypothetical protein
MKDKLIELFDEYGLIGGTPAHEKLATWLIDRKVIVLPCDLWDTVWFIAKKWEEAEYRVIHGVVGCIDIRDGWRHVIVRVMTDDEQDWYRHVLCFEDFGKIAFLNKEDAEQALLKWR